MIAEIVVMLVLLAGVVSAFWHIVTVIPHARREIRRLKRDLREALEEVARQIEARHTRFQRDEKQKAEFRRIIRTLRTTLQGIGVDDPTKPKQLGEEDNMKGDG